MARRTRRSASVLGRAPACVGVLTAIVVSTAVVATAGPVHRLTPGNSLLFPEEVRPITAPSLLDEDGSRSTLPDPLVLIVGLPAAGDSPEDARSSQSSLAMARFDAFSWSTTSPAASTSDPRLAALFDEVTRPSSQDDTIASSFDRPLPAGAFAAARGPGSGRKLYSGGGQLADTVAAEPRPDRLALTIGVVAATCAASALVGVTLWSRRRRHRHRA